MSPNALFSPFQLRHLHLSNRIAMAPMTRSKSPSGIPGAEVAAYYRRRAAAGVGLIITEGVEVSHPASSAFPDVPGLASEAALDGWRKVVAGVHAEGSAIFCQLWHVGGLRKQGMPPDPTVPGYTPSGLAGEGHKPVAHAMTDEDLAQVIDCYAADAARARALGFDGIELHGAHGYLIDQFFWAATNRRDDRYGGSLEARTRFACDLVRACRTRVGPDFPIGLRFSQWKQQDYEAKLARDPDELERFLTPLTEAGVDVFHASTRRFKDAEFEGSPLNLAGWTKRLTGKPCITVGSVGLDRDLLGLYRGEPNASVANITELLERLERGEFDLVALGRALLADPEWVQKVRTGRIDEIIGFTAEAVANYY